MLMYTMFEASFLILYRKAFIPANPKRDEFVFYLNKALKGTPFGGLVCSLSEQMYKTELVKKINKFLTDNSYSLTHCYRCSWESTIQIHQWEFICLFGWGNTASICYLRIIQVLRVFDHTNFLNADTFFTKTSIKSFNSFAIEKCFSYRVSAFIGSVERL